MIVVDPEVWLCEDCTLYAANGDVSGIDDEDRVKEVAEGVNALGPHLVCRGSNSDDDDDSGEDEFSTARCEGCGEWRAGRRVRFAILGEPIKLAKSMLDQGYVAGKLPSFTSIGCYPLVYVVRRSNQFHTEEGAWCAKCCNETHDPESTVMAADANYEDSSLYCDSCEERIESAYAEDEHAEESDA